MMHDIVIDELERHLSGNASRAFYQHLDACDSCRQEVLLMTEISGDLREEFAATASEEVPQPSPVFFRGIADRVNAQQQHQAFGLFSLGEVFFRRLAFASLMLLAGLGSYLVTQESSYAGANAVSVIAEHDPTVAHGPEQDRDQLLVNMVSYRP